MANKSVILIFLGFFLELNAYRAPRKYIQIIMLYNEKNNDRIQEYMTCIDKNLHHPLIHKIHVIYDTQKDEGDNKLYNLLISKHIPITLIKGRATYGYCFDVANNYYKNSNIILSNADIYFNNTLKNLDKIDLTNVFIVLTRWNVFINQSMQLQFINNMPNEYSHDAWIFRTPFRKFKDDNILIGVPGCDAAIVYRALQADFKVFNPCLSVQACHLHNSNLRHYDSLSYNPLIGYAPAKWTMINNINLLKKVY